MAEGLVIGRIEVSGNTTAETTTDDTPRKLATFDTVASQNRTTCSVSTNDIIIVEAGHYHITGDISFSGSLGKTFFVSVYQDSTAVGTPVERKLGTGGDVGAAPFSAGIDCDVGDVISTYHWSDDGGVAFTAHQLSITATRVY